MKRLKKYCFALLVALLIVSSLFVFSACGDGAVTYKLEKYQYRGKTYMLPPISDALCNRLFLFFYIQ